MRRSTRIRAPGFAGSMLPLIIGPVARAARWTFAARTVAAPPAAAPPVVPDVVVAAVPVPSGEAVGDAGGVAGASGAREPLELTVVK